MLRIGLGYDVHKLVEGRALILGGVSVPFERGLEGHSDADVLVHAVADACLGALRAGDIGKLFPDDDPAWADADSLELLKIITDMVNKQGFQVLDVDSVIAAQEPKLSPYRKRMSENIACALSIDSEQVGVKATTTEHLGFVGTGEGMAAQAVVLLESKES